MSGKQRNEYLVFLDTCILFGLRFDYKNRQILSLLELVEDSIVSVYLTDIVEKEILANIQDEVSNAVAAHTSFVRKAKILKNLSTEPFDTILGNVDSKLAVKLLNNQYKRFKKAGKVKIISTENVESKTIFTKYFSKRPPFGSGKKKCEFPDAFTLQAIKEWIKSNGKVIYIVSDDKDLKAACKAESKLEYINSLKEFLNLVFENEEPSIELLESLIDKNSDKFKEDIVNEFPKHGFWLIDQDGDVLDVDVIDTEILDYSVISIKGTEVSIVISAKVYFDADVSYDNLSTAIYDSEDKVLIPWEKIEKTVDCEMDVELEFFIKYSIKKEEFLSVELTTINNNENIDIEAEPYDPRG